MGKQLAKIYDVVAEKSGLDARMRLSSETGISKRKAEEAEDSPELLEKVKAAASQLIGTDIGALFIARTIRTI